MTSVHCINWIVLPASLQSSYFLYIYVVFVRYLCPLIVPVEVYLHHRLIFFSGVRPLFFFRPWARCERLTGSGIVYLHRRVAVANDALLHVASEFPSTSAWILSDTYGPWFPCYYGFLWSLFWPTSAIWIFLTDNESPTPETYCDSHCNPTPASPQTQYLRKYSGTTSHTTKRRSPA